MFKSMCLVLCIAVATQTAHGEAVLIKNARVISGAGAAVGRPLEVLSENGVIIKMGRL
jgi:hypothetical protein